MCVISNRKGISQQRVCFRFRGIADMAGIAARSTRSPIVKVCGCRPHDGGAAGTGGGVRKPPRAETAGGVTRSCVRRYGDFDAGGVLPRCDECFFGRRPMKRRARSAGRDMRIGVAQR